jgi:hypothetical protein
VPPVDIDIELGVRRCFLRKIAEGTEAIEDLAAPWLEPKRARRCRRFVKPVHHLRVDPSASQVACECQYGASGADDQNRCSIQPPFHISQDQPSSGRARPAAGGRGICQLTELFVQRYVVMS